MRARFKRWSVVSLLWETACKRGSWGFPHLLLSEALGNPLSPLPPTTENHCPDWWENKSKRKQLCYLLAHLVTDLTHRWVTALWPQCRLGYAHINTQWNPERTPHRAGLLIWAFHWPLSQFGEAHRPLLRRKSWKHNIKYKGLRRKPVSQCSYENLQKVCNRRPSSLY